MGEQSREAMMLRYQEARKTEIRDGESALRYLPDYAAYETAYGTKQYYEDIYRKLCAVPEEKRGGSYLLALMKTRDLMAETMFEYQAGIRDLFKETWRKNSWRNQEPNEQALAIAAAFLACRNHSLHGKHLAELEAMYEEQKKKPISDQAGQELDQAKAAAEEGQA